METEFRKSFVKDIKRHSNDEKLLARIQKIILEVEAADSILTINNLKKLKMEGSYYRIRSGSYRVGLIIENNTIILVRVLHGIASKRDLSLLPLKKDRWGLRPMKRTDSPPSDQGCRGCLKALCWRGVDGQCYIMLAGLCNFAQETRPKVGAGAMPWPLVCRLRRNGMKMNRRLKKINRLF